MVRATARRRDHVVELLEAAKELALHRRRVRVAARVRHRLPAAGLVERIAHLDAEPLEQLERRHPDLGHERVDVAGMKSPTIQPSLPTLWSGPLPGQPNCNGAVDLVNRRNLLLRVRLENRVPARDFASRRASARPAASGPPCRGSRCRARAGASRIRIIERRDQGCVQLGSHVLRHAAQQRVPGADLVVGQARFLGRRHVQGGRALGRGDRVRLDAPPLTCSTRFTIWSHM